MPRRAHAGPGGPDPVVVTLREALAEAPPRPTLLWGRGLGPVSRDLHGTVRLRSVVPDLAATRGMAGSHTVAHAPELGDEERYVCRQPRSRQMLAWMMEVAASHLPEGGEVWVAGHHNEGIRSAVRTMAEFLVEPRVIRIKRHTRVLVATAPGHAEAPDAMAHSKTFQVHLGDVTLEAITLPGTFSHGRLDKGTQALAALLTANPPRGRVLDLGAGGGALGLVAAASEAVTRVVLCEHAASAVASIQATLRANGLADDARIEASLTSVNDAPDGPFDLVVANPPFHVGRHQDRTWADGFARAAGQRLASDGQLLMVANRHLGYAEDLRETFSAVDVAWEDSRYRIWRCAKPRQTAPRLK